MYEIASLPSSTVEKWWTGLDTLRQAQLKNYAMALYYDGGEFIANRNPLVQSSFV